MMILSVLLFSVITFVSSQPSQVPYIQSVEAMEDLVDLLEDKILSMEFDVPDIIDGRRHYAVLLTHLMRVADRLRHLGPIYEVAYIDEMPVSIAIGLNNMDIVVAVTKDLMKDIDNRTKKIQPLIEALCPDRTMPEVCNQMIHHAVVGDPTRYDDDANMLLNVGKVAQGLLDAKLVEVALEYKEIEYLIQSIHALNPLVFNIVRVLTDLRKVEIK